MKSCQWKSAGYTAQGLHGVGLSYMIWMVSTTHHLSLYYPFSLTMTIQRMTQHTPQHQHANKWQPSTYAPEHLSPPTKDLYHMRTRHTSHKRHPGAHRRQHKAHIQQPSTHTHCSAPANHNCCPRTSAPHNEQCAPHVEEPHRSQKTPKHPPTMTQHQRTVWKMPSPQLTMPHPWTTTTRHQWMSTAHWHESPQMQNKCT